MISCSRKSYPTGQPRTTTVKNTTPFRPIPPFKRFCLLVPLSTSGFIWSVAPQKRPETRGVPYSSPPLTTSRFSPFLLSLSQLIKMSPSGSALSGPAIFLLQQCMNRTDAATPLAPDSDQPPTFFSTYLSLSFYLRWQCWAVSSMTWWRGSARAASVF